MIVTLILRYWKIWLPALVFVLACGTGYAAVKRIDSLKNQRDVAVYQASVANAQSEKLLEDIERINSVMVERGKKSAKLEKEYSAAMERIRDLSSDREDVSNWLDARIPDGLWQASRHGEDTPP